MVAFVHITTSDNVRRIRTVGIHAARRPGSFEGRGLYAHPVSPDFFVTHQWLRELKRSRGGRLCGVYFRIPDEEVVLVGHYGRLHVPMAASEAAAKTFAAAELGLEVVVRRGIKPAEIFKVKSLPNTIGWRYFPAANGKAPCPCEFCQAGSYGGAKLRERASQSDRALGRRPDDEKMGSTE